MQLDLVLIRKLVGFEAWGKGREGGMGERKGEVQIRSTITGIEIWGSRVVSGSRLV